MAHRRTTSWWSESQRRIGPHFRADRLNRTERADRLERTKHWASRLPGYERGVRQPSDPGGSFGGFSIWGSRQESPARAARFPPRMQFPSSTGTALTIRDAREVLIVVAMATAMNRLRAAAWAKIVWRHCVSRLKRCASDVQDHQQLFRRVRLSLTIPSRTGPPTNSSKRPSGRSTVRPLYSSGCLTLADTCSLAVRVPGIADEPRAFGTIRTSRLGTATTT